MSPAIIVNHSTHWRIRVGPPRSLLRARALHCIWERNWTTLATEERYERPDSQHYDWCRRGNSNDTRPRRCLGTSTDRYRDSLTGTSAVRGNSGPARLLCVEHSRQRILLWPSVLGISKRWLVRRLELERALGGCPTHARAGPDSSGSGALLPSPPVRMAGISSRCTTALGRALRPRVARRGS